MKDDTTKNKIIHVTVDCIGKYGIQSITNRLIAKEADVNSAAINYYFSSKENLINEAIKRSLDNYLSEFLSSSPEQKQNSDTSNVLKKFSKDTLKDALSTPFFIKSYLYDPIIYNDYNGIFIERLNTFLTHLCQKADSCVLGETPEEIKMSIMQIVSSLMFVCLLPDFFQNFLDMDIKSPENQEYFVDLLMKRYCFNSNINNDISNSNLFRKSTE